MSRRVGVCLRGHGRVDEFWRERAACAGSDAAWFLVERESVLTGRKAWLSYLWVGVDHARSVCSGCPVRKDCLQYALGRHDAGGGGGDPGMYGGFTQAERVKVLRKILSNGDACSVTMLGVMLDDRWRRLWGETSVRLGLEYRSGDLFD